MVEGVVVRGVAETIGVLRDYQIRYGRDHVWIVGVGAEYGAYLELGTAKMQAYPFLFPAARHVMARDFARIEAESRTQSDSIGYIVSEVAKAIERQAKINATAARGSGRSQGTHPDHPQVQTGNLRASIRAYPAKAAFGGTPGFIGAEGSF